MASNSRLPQYSPLHGGDFNTMDIQQNEKSSTSVLIPSSSTRCFPACTSQNGSSLLTGRSFLWPQCFRFPSNLPSFFRRRSPVSSEKYQIVFSISFYIIVAIVMVLLNKAVLTMAPHLPFTLLFLQMALSVIFLHLSAWCGIKKKALPRLNMATCKALLPLIAINVVGLSLNTLCLGYIDASLYQVARSLILPMTVFLSQVFLGQSSSKWVLFSCFLIFVGFMCGVVYENQVHISTLGILFGILSSMTTASHAIIIKTSFGKLNGSSGAAGECKGGEKEGGNTLDLVYYNNLLSGIVLLPVWWLSGEVGSLVYLFETWKNLNPGETLLMEGGGTLSQFLAGILLSGFFGYLINVAGFLQIKVTSPVTHMISSAVRGVLQTGLAVLFFGDMITLARATGISLILVGSSLYTYFKSLESSRRS